MKIALAMICKGSDDEAIELYRCLAHTAHEVDGVFVTVTNKPGEEPNTKVKEVVEQFGGVCSFFEWKNDFSAARNFNFSQVPKEYDYILWCDADDIFRGIEKLRSTIENNSDIDVFTFFYLYAFDNDNNPVVVHLKSQVVRNDGCVEWVGKLHEDFKENRRLTIKLVKNIERIHLSSEKRFNDAKERNLIVANEQLTENPNDPRSYWNVGNSLKALGRNKEALDAFNKFLELSNSDDEKYIVYIRIAECYMGIGDFDSALKNARHAIGIIPEYPDAYFVNGSLLAHMGKLEQARDMYLSGLTKPKPYHKILVYNPRDYDWVPMNNLAKIYFDMGFPQLALPLLKGCLKITPSDKRTRALVRIMEKESKKANDVLLLAKKLSKKKTKEELERALNRIPKEFVSHPAICHIRNINFVKEESSGRDVSYVCGYTSEVWTPETAKKKGIGGSEEAVINLSKLLVEKGWNVTVYNNCGHEIKTFDGVTYKPFWMWNYRDKVDVTILWRANIKMADYDINTKKLFIDYHDVMPEGEFTNKRLNKIDKIFVKSKFHRELFPSVSDDKFAIVPNGILSDVFLQGISRDPKLIINTSSPDRSLGALIDLFVEVKKRVPDARLKWAYGWNVFDAVHSGNSEIMKWKQDIIKKMEESGVENLGRIGHDEIARLYLEASILGYPSEFAEIDMISLSKAMAAGAIPVTTDFSAMGEKMGHGGVFIHSDKNKDNWCPPGQYDHSIKTDEQKKQWVDAVVAILENPPTEEERLDMRRWAMDKFDWKSVANEWDKIFNS